MLIFKDIFNFLNNFSMQGLALDIKRDFSLDKKRDFSLVNVKRDFSLVKKSDKNYQAVMGLKIFV